LKRSEPKNLFELENLEQRILLSGDSLVGAMPGAAPDELEPLFDPDSVLPPVEEVLLTDDHCQEENCSLQSDPYDPSEQVDNIFSGVTEEELSGEGDQTSSDTAYMDRNISGTQKDHFSRGLKELGRLGGVLESFNAFASELPLVEESSLGGLIGLSEILDTRLAKPVFDYFNDATDPPSTEGVLQTLKEIPETYDDLDMTVDSLAGGFAPADNEIRFVGRGICAR
jgi:hypothetical protein